MSYGSGSAAYNRYGYSTYKNAAAIGYEKSILYEFKNISTMSTGKYRRQKSSVANTTYSRGTTQYSDVTSTSRGGYPDNNYSGSYWYVYKGVY